MNKKGNSRDFVTEKFKKLYMMKWKGQGKTATEFVRAIQEVMPEALCDYKYVSKWLSGYMSPKKYLPAICQVLDVDLSEFTPKSHSERYQYASDYADGLEGRLEEIAEKNFKIDLTFFQGLRNIIPDFDSVFPLFAPLHWYGVGDINHKPYQRAVPAEATETSSGQGLFQITKDGRTVFLTKYDMKFIRGLQVGIRKCVTAQFEAHQKALEKAEADANALFWEKNMEVNPEFAEDNTLWVTYKLCEEELQEVDSYGIYSEEEEKRFRLPRVGTPLYDDNTETEG